MNHTTTEDRLREVLKAADWAVQTGLPPIFLSWPMLFLSVVLILQWHIRANFTLLDGLTQKRRPHKVTRKFGVHAIVLQIYFNKNMPTFISSRPFVCSLFFAFFDNIVLYYGTEKLVAAIASFFGTTKVPRGYLRLDSHGFHDDVLDEDVDDDGIDDDEKDVATSLYMDMLEPFRKVVPVFIVQGALGVFYVDELNSNKDTHNAKNADYLFWLIGVLVILYCGPKQLGDPYSGVFWEGLHDKLKPVLHEHGRSSWCFSLSYAQRFNLRRAMDFCINSLCRTVICNTFPILLSTEEPLDFVKDCTAIFFLTTLDDIDADSNQKSQIEQSAKIKFQLIRDSLDDYSIEKGFVHRRAVKFELTQEEREFALANHCKFDAVAKYGNTGQSTHIWFHMVGLPTADFMKIWPCPWAQSQRQSVKPGDSQVTGLVRRMEALEMQFARLPRQVMCATLSTKTS